VRAVLADVDPTGADIARFAVHTATLDDVFLALTGHAAGAPDTELAKETIRV
jgi:ABC-2 type transport system ATP-binding protein